MKKIVGKITLNILETASVTGLVLQILDATMNLVPIADLYIFGAQYIKGSSRCLSVSKYHTKSFTDITVSIGM